MLSMIAAMGKDRVIGKDNTMPWHLPADLQHFKQTTMNCPIIMGRKTYDSIGRPLPGRLNVVLSKDKSLQIDGCQVANSVEDALSYANHDAKNNEANKNNEVFITGGSYLYNLFLQKADRLYLTFIDEEFQGDTYFPDYSKYAWNEIERIHHEPDEKNPYSYSFVTLDRVT